MTSLHLCYLRSSHLSRHDRGQLREAVCLSDREDANLITYLLLPATRDALVRVPEFGRVLEFGVTWGLAQIR